MDHYRALYNAEVKKHGVPFTNLLIWLMHEDENPGPSFEDADPIDLYVDLLGDPNEDA